MPSRAPAPRPPLYARIETRLREAIAEGRHPVGTQLPTEAELCGTLKVSRHTVREALRRLVEAGLVERRQGAGSIVVAREAPRGQVHAIRSLDGLTQYAADTRLMIQHRGLTPLTPEAAAQALGEPGTPWLRVEGLRLGQDGRPQATADILINPRFAEIEPEVPERTAIHSTIEQRYGVEVAEVVQEITAGPMPVAVCTALRARPRAVGMYFMRRYVLTDGDTLLVSRSWHKADRFTYAMRLKRRES